MQRIRKGDEVIVITGRDKGKKGTVTAVHDDGKVVVEGINIVKKHVKPNPHAGPGRRHYGQDASDRRIQRHACQPQNRQG